MAEFAILSEVTSKLLQALCESLHWDLGQLWCIDTEAGVMHFVYTWHQPELDVAEFEASMQQLTFTPGIGLVGHVWVEKNLLWVANIAQEPNFQRRSAAMDAAFQQAYAFPILVEDTVLGTISVFNQKPQPPDDDLLATMTTIRRQLGQFIERKRVEEAIQWQNQRSHIFSAMTLLIRQSFDLDVILSTTVSEVRESLGADRVIIYRFEEGLNGCVVV